MPSDSKTSEKLQSIFKSNNPEFMERIKAMIRKEIHQDLLSNKGHHVDMAKGDDDPSNNSHDKISKADQIIQTLILEYLEFIQFPGTLDIFKSESSSFRYNSRHLSRKDLMNQLGISTDASDGTNVPLIYHLIPKELFRK